jgi:hypothetical protein
MGAGTPFPTAHMLDRGGFGLDGIFRFNANQVIERAGSARGARRLGQCHQPRAGQIRQLTQRI